MPLSTESNQTMMKYFQCHLTGRIWLRLQQYFSIAVSVDHRDLAETAVVLQYQLTVGTWLRLYSLALRRRLAMLLAMFMP